MTGLSFLSYTEEVSLALKNNISNNQILVDQLVSQVIECITAGNKVIMCGNGGSFQDSMYISAELVVRFKHNCKPLPALCLGANQSITTAISNDFSYDNIFSRELKALAQPQDILIAMSTSGLLTIS